MKTNEIRVQKLREMVERAGTIAAFARLYDGVDPTYVSQILNGHRSFGEKAARKMEVLTGLPEKYFDNDLVEISSLPATNKNQVTINQFDAQASMGTGLELPDQPGVIQSWNVDKRWLDLNVRTYSAAKNLCIVTGFGDSMIGMFNPGDPLLVDMGVKTVEFDAAYFFRIGNQGYIKRLQRIPTENGLILKAISANKEVYEPFDITEKMDFQVIGRVLKVWESTDF